MLSSLQAGSRAASELASVMEFGFYETNTMHYYILLM